MYRRRATLDFWTDFVQRDDGLREEISSRETAPVSYDSLASRVRRRVTSFADAPDSKIASHPVRFTAKRAGHGDAAGILLTSKGRPEYVESVFSSGFLPSPSLPFPILL